MVKMPLPRLAFEIVSGAYGPVDADSGTFCTSADVAALEREHEMALDVIDALKASVAHLLAALRAFEEGTKVMTDDGYDAERAVWKDEQARRGGGVEGMSDDRRPTIAELEAILDQEGVKVEIAPDGQVTTTSEIARLREQVEALAALYKLCWSVTRWKSRFLTCSSKN